MIHARLARAPLWWGWTWVVAAGVAYAGLLHWLAVNGEVPSATAGLPFAAAEYYGIARLYIVPLLLVGAAIFSGVTRRVAGIERTAGLPFAYGAPLLLCFVVPDLVAYGVGGHAAMGALVRVSAPITAILMVASGARAVRARNGSRPVLAPILGVLAQAVVVAPLLR